MYAGIATHFCPSEKIQELEEALINLENPNEIERVLDNFCPPVDGEFSLSKYLEQIDTCFSASTIEEILLNLENDGSDWAKQTIKVSLLNLKLRISAQNSFNLFFKFLDTKNCITDLFKINTA